MSILDALSSLFHSIPEGLKDVGGAIKKNPMIISDVLHGNPRTLIQGVGHEMAGKRALKNVGQMSQPGPVQEEQAPVAMEQVQQPQPSQPVQFAQLPTQDLNPEEDWLQRMRR